jgi:hypothetical protein
MPREESAFLSSQGIRVLTSLLEYEQDFLWSHTREIRERRQPVVLAIEGKKKHGETEFEFVRTKKKHHERKPSPSPLVTFLAGGKR